MIETPLTEQERRKIYEEEKARFEAREKLKKSKRLGCFLPGLLVILVLLAIIIALPLHRGKKEREARPTKIISVPLEETVLFKLEVAGIWKVDRLNHRCLIDRGVWDRLPFEKKEQCLQVIYIEEKTWWKIYDEISGKLLGEVSSWGWKIHP